MYGRRFAGASVAAPPPRRTLGGVARLEQQPGGVPRPRAQLVAGPVRDPPPDHAVADAHFLLLHVHRHALPRIAAHRPLQPEHVVVVDGQARDAEHGADAEEDLGERTADDGADAPLLEGLGRVLARGAAAEVQAGHQHRGPFVRLLVERMLGIVLARVLEGVQAQPLVGHRLEEPRRDDPIGVDVVARHRNASSRHLPPRALAHRAASAPAGCSLCRTAGPRPFRAAAAAIAGLISKVRPVGLPWLPMKFRLLVEALISRPRSLSSFMPRHIEQPALRHSKPASRKISWRPSASAALATCCEPGTTMARTLFATRCPLATAAATRRSGMGGSGHEPGTPPPTPAPGPRGAERGGLAREPMKTTSILAPAMGWPASKPMWARPSR